ncbi:MAG: diguanylate cyclase [Bordetella sp.]|nr:diguanylate cyclase [Pseudomonadota bacterium]
MPATALSWRRLSWCIGPLFMLVLALLTLASARADTAREPLRLARQAGGMAAVHALQVLEDDSRALTLEQVRSAPDMARFAYPPDPLRGKEADRVLWFRLEMRLADPADASRDWLMVVPTVSTHEIRFYGPFDADGKALAPAVVTGMRHPWASRPVASEQMAWRFRLPGPGVYTAYFRVDSTFARIYDVKIWDPVDYLQSTQDKRMFDALTYGLLIGLMVYGLVLFKVFGEALYGFYVLACATGILALSSINGHALRYAFPDWPAAAEFAYGAGPALWAVCKLQFGRRLLRLRHFAPRLDLLVQAITVALLLAVPYAFWGAYPLATFRLVQLSVVGSTAVMVVGALIAMRRRYWPAVLYFFGVAMLLAGIGAIVVASWGWIAWAPNQMNISQGALLAELIVFGVAMGSRLQLVHRSERALAVRTEQLVQALGTDALTGVASRAAFDSAGEARLRDGNAFAVAMLDLDGFKAVNDKHGHAAGDAVLVAVAQRLRERLGSGELVARLGGDEFALLLAERPVHALAELAEDLLDACRAPVRFDGLDLVVGASAGIAVHGRQDETLAQLLRRADRAMYDAKRQRPGLPLAFADGAAAAR